MARGVSGGRWQVVLICAAAVAAAGIAVRFAVPTDRPATPRPALMSPAMTMTPGMTMMPGIPGTRGVPGTPGMTPGPVAGAGGPQAVPTAVMVHLSELTIDPKEVTVAEGGTLEVMNVGSMPHDLVVAGTSLATKMLNADGDEDLVLTGLPIGTYTINCAVLGHAEAGMVATLHVARNG